MDASMLTNSSISPDVFGGEILNQKLLETDDTDKQISLLSDFLTNKLAENGQRDALIEDTLVYIDQNISVVGVEKVHMAFGISERQLQRRFKQNVGIAPQLYIRIRRINEAFRLMDSKRFERLADIAHELNFHDQSHFIRDIKAFSGINPKDVSQKVNDFHHDQVGSSYMYR
jgi:AraC-like DNA-binding protein